MRHLLARDDAMRRGRVFAARSRGDQQRCRQQDRQRQRHGHKYDRCLHRCPIAMLIIAPCRAGNANGLKKRWGYAGIGIAMETLIDSTVRVTITHSHNEPIASEAATAFLSRDDATGAERP